jgi:murein L,D-transpeptidase YcbB/YkuD
MGGTSRLGQALQNALGQVKFIFPTHIIFMHDTPSKAYLIENKGPLVMVVFG